jgi:hypothetical protein
MTMQVGMHACDGILLASDTYITNPPLLGRTQLWCGGRHGTDSTKLQINHAKGIAIACSGDMNTACLMAEAILSGWDDRHLTNPEGILEDFCESVAGAHRQRAQCLVVLTRPNPQMFIVNTMPNTENVWEPWCKPSSKVLIAGDTINSAIYWIEKYSRGWIRHALPMERLIPLAAHMIGQSKTLNTAGINGLDILVCNSMEIKRLSKISCELLERQAEQWDDAIRDLFLSHQPQYVYDSCPNS